MKSGVTPRSVVIWFFIVAILYLALFYGVEYWNHRKGGWEVQFISDEMGNPSIVIDEPKLKISSVEIIFAGEKLSATNLSQKVLFERPFTKLPAPMPMGEVIYQDLRSLPGVVTFNFFGHEIELLPRVLIVNKKEIPWKSERVIELSPAEKPAQSPKPPKGWQAMAITDRRLRIANCGAQIPASDLAL